MKENKKFDCVVMKNEIQARLLKELHGLSDEKIRSKRLLRLEKSHSSVGRLWRELEKKNLLIGA